MEKGDGISNCFGAADFGDFGSGTSFNWKSSQPGRESLSMSVSDGTSVEKIF